MTLDLDDDGLHLNGEPLALPCPTERLRAVLGEPRRQVLERNTMLTWDAHGLLGRSADGERVQSLEVAFAPGSRHAFAPRAPFSGEARFGDLPLLTYYAEHPGARRMAFRGGRRTALVRGGVQAYFVVRQGRVASVTFEAYEGEDEPAEPEARELPPAAADAVARYRALWGGWVAAVRSHLGEANEYDNLGLPAPEREIAAAGSVLPEGRLPDALRDFYRAGDVDYDGVTSAYAFFVGPPGSAYGLAYDLLPLNLVARRWREIQELAAGFDDEGEDYGSALRATGYANPAWVPFAESRQGDYLLVDPDPGPTGTRGQVVELVNEDWTRGVVADSLAELLRDDAARVRAEGATLLAWIVENG